LLKGIIFDFDGVIAESVQVKTDGFAFLYGQYGKDIVRKVVEHHEANGGMSRFEKIKYYHGSFLKQSITEMEIRKLANLFSEFVIEKVIAASYVPGVLEYIQKYHAKCKLFISTGTPTDEMKQILTGRKIAHYFSDIFGSPNKKEFHIKNILSNYGMRPEELLFYGDSNTDLGAAAFYDIQFVLRLHALNKKNFTNFNGPTIQNFLSLDVNTLLSNESVS